MSELRRGAQLKKVEHINNHSIEFELTPYEILMEDIRSRRYTLNKVMVRQFILMYLESIDNGTSCLRNVCGFMQGTSCAHILCFAPFFSLCLVTFQKQRDSLYGMQIIESFLPFKSRSMMFLMTRD
jgi:hypothetical protein